MNMPVVWTIGGSDSGGGAGIQADLHTMANFGIHGCSVITAVTAQNTKSVTAINPISTLMISQQISSLNSDLPPCAIKTGMLYSSQTVQAVSAYLNDINAPLVLDPVMVATSGDSLIQSGFIESIRNKLLTRASIVTANIQETEKLLGRLLIEQDNVESFDKEIELAAEDLLCLGVKAVLIKGGDRVCSDLYSQDYFSDGNTKFWITSNRLNRNNTHGSGCALASAIACGLANGYSLTDALVIAKSYVTGAIRQAKKIGSGSMNLFHVPFNCHEEDFPWITQTAKAGRQRPEFSSCLIEAPLGFYPIIDSKDLLLKLIKAGSTLVQLRIKHLSGSELEREIKECIDISHKYNCRLFINDYWELAIKYNAYGVHLGQEDLLDSDVYALEKAGIKLGISTHCHSEVARALGVRPSYIAIGPIFDTTTKIMDFPPQGVSGFKYWRKVLSYPLVAIGGIFLDNAKQILEAGADAISVVRDISNATEVEKQCQKWLRLWEKIDY